MGKQEHENQVTDVMLATEQGEQQAGEQLVTPDILSELMAQMRFKVNMQEARLQSEESGSAIASLQGYCAGHRTLMKCIRETGFEDFRFNERSEQPWEGDEECVLDFEEIIPIHEKVQELIRLDAWGKLHTFMEQEVTAKKDALFYKSDKGRDLHFCKGWYEAMTQLDNWIDLLDNDFSRMKAQEEKRQHEKLEELDF